MAAITVWQLLCFMSLALNLVLLAALQQKDR